MKPTTRFFLKAVALAIVLISAGFTYAQYKHSRTATLQRNCELESQREMSTFNSRQADQSGPWKMYQTAGATCDPHKLWLDTPYGTVLPGLQGELLNAYSEERGGIENALYGFAALIMFIGALPAIWYFFLARLAEIAAALRRN